MNIALTTLYQKIKDYNLSVLQKPELFRLAGVDPTKSMDWKENLKASLILNMVFFLWAMLALLTQSLHLFWNPDGIKNMEPTTAFNTAVSFMTNTNLQHYSGDGQNNLGSCKPADQCDSVQS